MSNVNELSDAIKKAYEAVEAALEVYDMTKDAGTIVHPSIENRLVTVKSILSEIIPDVEHATSLDSRVKDWYQSNYPDDEFGDHINPEATFVDIANGLNRNQDVYGLLRTTDSLIREKVFGKLSDLLAVDYSVIYRKWLGGSASPSIPIPAETAKKSVYDLEADIVSCIRKGDTKVQEVTFESLRAGDTIFVKGCARIVEEDAHYSGDASYDGYLLYDTEGESWFPRDLDFSVTLTKSNDNVSSKPTLDSRIQTASMASDTALSGVVKPKEHIHAL